MTFTSDEAGVSAIATRTQIHLLHQHATKVADLGQFFALFVYDRLFKVQLNKN